MNERTSSPVLKTIKAVQTRATEFRSLLDTDAQEAIQHARDMKAISALAETVNLLKAGIFIDGGAITQEIDVVKEGVVSGGREGANSGGSGSLGSAVQTDSPLSLTAATADTDALVAMAAVAESRTTFYFDRSGLRG